MNIGNMKSSGNNSKFVAAVAMGVVLLMTLVVTPASANPGLTVNGALLITDVTAGQTLTHKIIVSISDKDSATDISVQVVGMQQSQAGASELLEPSKDTGDYSARAYITVDKESFHLEPGGSQELTATINIPSDVGAGGRYAIINIQTKPAGQGSVGVITAVNIPIYLTIKDSQLIHTGKITGITTSEPLSGQPVDILTTFQNTGNHHFKVKSEVTVSDAQGEVLDTIYTALTPSSLIPTMSSQLKATYIPKGELTPGVYTIKSKVMRDDGTILDETSGSFTVAWPYIPPPPPAGVTLNPGNASVMETADKAISISFPKGAVTGQVDISLRSYPVAQLPSPPANYSVATTCFRVDGLTGLLAQQAAVTVKYTGADLDKAKGEAGRLTMARWDEAANQWSVLKTKVDTSAMTLTTQTNQFSIWAVMVAPSAKTNWLLIGGAIAAGIIIIAALVAVLTRKKKVRQ